MVVIVNEMKNQLDARTVRLHKTSQAGPGCDNNSHNLLNDFLVANLTMLTKALFV
jgi:hypothetical protein